MSQIPEFHRQLAEAVSPLSHSLAAGLLIRPVPLRPGSAQDRAEDAAAALCLDLDALLRENVPLMKEAMGELQHSSLETLEELVDELASPALELVDMARRIWETPLPQEAEGARSILATLAEAPVTQLLQWVLEVMHLAVDPWSIAENPEAPEPGFVLLIPDGPVRDALRRWRQEHPGVLPEEVLR